MPLDRKIFLFNYSICAATCMMALAVLYEHSLHDRVAFVCWLISGAGAIALFAIAVKHRSRAGILLTILLLLVWTLPIDFIITVSLAMGRCMAHNVDSQDCLP